MDLTWVGPYKPVPDRSGADLRSYYLMRELKRRGASLDGYFMGSHGNDCDQFLDQSTVRTNSAIGSIAGTLKRRFLSGIPLTVGRFFSSEISQQLPQDQLIYVDHLHLTSNVLDRSEGYWLDEHNVESDLWEQYASLCYQPKRWFINREAAALRTFETDVIRQSAGTGLPTSPDLSNLPQSARQKISLIPNGVPQEWLDSGERRLQDSLDTVTVFGFIGKYDWFPNKFGMEKFLNDVWKPFYANHSETRLVLAGQSPPDSWRGVNGVTVRGYVESKADFFRSIDAFVIPLALGSGTRLKALEAAAKGIPLLSTEKGVEGLSFDDLRTVDEITDLRDLMIDINNNPSRWDKSRRSVYRTIGETYRWSTIGKKLWDRLESIA
ncbi:MAG: glycosyltransferase [bacterium]